MILKNQKRKVVLSFISIAMIFCIAISCFGISGFSSQVQADTNAPRTTNNAVAFLNVNGSFVNELQGGQNEYVYFGKNITSSTANTAGYGNSIHTGEIKWRVLSINDFKYGQSGTVLLWSDYELGASFYNNFTWSRTMGNKYYAFYGTSLVRALLNSGVGNSTYQHLNNVNSASGLPSLMDFQGTSYYQGIFNDNERALTSVANNIVTHDFVHNTSSSPHMSTQVATTYYVTPNVSVASSTTNIDTSQGTVTEISTGDVLFLLDYEDINNVGYGFGDNGLTYAQKYNSSWSGWQDGYPTACRGGGNDTNYSTYLQYSGDIQPYWWLREAGRHDNDDHSIGLMVGKSGSVNDRYVGADTGIRPAFNLDVTNLIYASANTSTLSNTFIELASTDDKPAYKLYIKDDTYTNNDANKPKLVKTGNTLTATFNSTSATHAVALLSRRDATNHEVVYQADASISNNKSNFTLPSDVDINDYIVTIMTTSNNGGYSTENVYEQYTYDSVYASYYKVDKSGLEVPFTITATEPQEVAFGGDLYTPTSGEVPDTNHQFVGWTLEKDGSGKVFTTVIDGVPWEAKLYAVWKLPDDKVKPVITPSGNTLVQTGNKASIVYGYDKVTLTASITSDVMNDLEFTCQWSKAGTELTGAKQKTYSNIINVKDSDSYTFDYVYYSKAEPLWRGSGTATSMEVEIKPAPLRVDELQLSGNPYSGRPLEEIAPDPVMKNDQNEIIEGTAEWRATGIVGNTPGIITNGRERRSFYFTPDEKYNGNYGGRELYSGDYEIEYLKIAFKISGETLYSDLEYGNTYSYNRIANMFQKVFVEYFESIQGDPELAGSFDGRTPFFNVNGQKIAMSDFKAITGDLYTDVKTPQEIEVSFDIKNYTVTFDPNNDGQTSPWTVENVQYNKFLSKPTDPKNGNLLFMGWYYSTDELDTSTGKFKEAKWDFDESRVTGDTTLTAKWLTADRLDSVSVEIADGAVFYAGGDVKKGDLVVTAVYIGNIGGEDIPQPMELAWEDYENTITYEPFGRLTITDPTNPKVTVKLSYTFKGHTEYGEAEITVTPNKIDTSSLDFGQNSRGEITFEADGTPKNLHDLDESEYLPLGIDSIEYKYFDARNNPINPEDVVRAGTYYVRVEFTSLSYDNVADPLTFLLILGTFTEVKVVWDYDDSNPYMYNGRVQAPTAKVYRANGTEITNITPTYKGDTEVSARGNYKISIELSGSYKIIDGESCDFRIVKAVLDAPALKDDMTITYDGSDKKFEDFFDINTDLIRIDNGGIGTDAGNYTAILSLKDTINCEWSSTSGATGGTVQVKWSIEKAHLTAVWDSDEHVADGNEFTPKVTSLIGIASTDLNAVDYENDIICKPSEGASKTEVGAYTIKAELNNPNEGWKKNYILDGNVDWAYVIVPQEGMQVITIEWLDTDLTFNGKVQMPSYIVWDKDGNDITEQVKDILTFGGDYDKSKWADDYQLTVNQPSNTYFIKSGLTCNYSISIDENGNGYNPNPDDGENDNKGGVDFDSILQGVKDYWQAIVSGVCIILIVAFLAKTASYESRRKKANKTAEERYSHYYAGATGLFGLASTSWTIIACVFIGVTVASLVIMLIAKSRCSKAEDSLAYAKEDFEHNKAEAEARQRDENMRMMFMSMMGGNNGNMGQGMPQGGFAGGYGIGVEEMRGLISETVTALLPGVQQALPQQASTSDEVIKQIMKTQEDLAHNQELLMNKMAEQPSEKIVTVADSADSETIKKLIEKSQQNDETIKQMMKNQEALIAKLLEKDNAPQVIEKVVEKEVPVEKVVEKEVIKEVPVEKIVEVPVEKVVEKEVVKEVKVAVPVATPSKPKKETAPRLTLDEAYALLSKQQQKYFDGLREYALSKDKCKEKKSTYFIVIGQSTVNPLIKLTIKKNMTVALFKMEDEYLKDIKRDATSDGTKVKVKETEVIISDAQSCKVAKNMIDLREDQIERYQELLREQKALGKRK